MITEVAGFALVAAIGAAQVRAHRAAAARAGRAAHQAHLAALGAAWEAGRRGEWAQVFRGGWLPRIATAPDPGNPGRALTLCRDPHGLATEPGGRVLLAVNATPGPDGTHTVHVLPVPDRFSDPVEAAAWTYDDPTDSVRVTRDTYAQLVRRT